MFAPTRLFLSLRPQAPAGLIFSAIVVAALFAATPFLLPAVADRFDVSLGRSALISTLQVAGFATTTFIAARRASPSRRLMAGAGLASVAANAASAAFGSFGLLLVLRLAAGISAGVLVWLAWNDAMKESAVMRDVAAVGPFTALVAAPLFGWLASSYGDQAIYLVLAGLSVPIAFFALDFEGGRWQRRRMSPSRSNLVLLAALGMLTMFGSSLFVFVASIGEVKLELGAVAVALAYSVNALSGFIGARIKAPVGSARWFVLGIVVASGSVGLIHHPIVLYAGMALWGFSFWMTVPDVLGRIADWSLVPQERVGDAQAVMALGRAFGPLLGASLVGDGAFGSLTVLAMSGLTVVFIVLTFVGRYRADRQPPALRQA